MIQTFYKSFLLRYPFVVIAFVLICVGFLSSFAPNLHIDASSKTLILEDDSDFIQYQKTQEIFGSDNILIISFSPKKDLFEDDTLKTIEQISEDIIKLPEITSVTSILNVPLLLSPPRPLSELVSQIPTLFSGHVDTTLAKKEFLSSPFYKNALVSQDLQTTALVLSLKEEISQATNHKLIQKLRHITQAYQDKGELFLGGVNMISDDMIEFIKLDLKLYGSLLTLIMIAVLWIIFRELRWIVITLFISFLSIISSIGILGLFDWAVTVISSNFISLQLIITISITLHLIVRYRELAQQETNKNQKELVFETIELKLSPSLLAVLTTIVGFVSLTLSEILPVINLGLMMSLSIFISLLIAFVVFPSFLVLLPKSTPYLGFEKGFHLPQKLFDFMTQKTALLWFITTMITLFSLYGVSKLHVENSFINYFKKDTEIYRGLQTIDQKLGGTTPLDIVITFLEPKIQQSPQKKSIVDEFSDFIDEFRNKEDDKQYWFTSSRMQIAQKVHNYLEKNPYIGNVQSLASILKVGKILNDNKDLDSFQLALLYNKLPLSIQKIILTPYLNIEKNQLRFATRIIDSDETLRRNELINQIQNDLQAMLETDNVTIELSNLMILYNNMLQSLFESQILTLGFVALLLMSFFLLVFRSIALSCVALITNILPIVIVFGLMGWFAIPLDMMTITIASIGLGISVDDTIHYIHRYKEEYAHVGDGYIAAQNSHQSIGYAMYYTSLVISIGFFVLVFSNFMPTLYFGLLTVLVMITALLSSLTLLPRLLIILSKKNAL